MANKYHTYFGQVITNSELNEIFDALFVEVDRFIQDFGYRGIVTGANVAQHSPTNLSVDIDGPTIVYDQAANRMAFASLTNVNLALDENGAATPVIGSLNEKWLSLFMQFVTTPTDPRTDDLGNTIYFKDVESFRINVVQGSEAAIGTPTKPALRSNQILISDVLLGYGVTAIVNAKISSARSQVAYDLTGTPLAVRAKNFADVLQQFLNALNAGLTTISGLDVDAMIADALTGSPTSIPSGNVHGILQAMLNATNSAKNAADAAQVEVDTYPAPARIMLTDSVNQLATGGSINPIGTDANTAQFGVNVLPSDDPYAGAGAPNKWKHVFFFKYKLNGGYLQLWTGGDDTKGNFALTLNALWTVSTQQWTQRASGPTRPSYALLFFEDKIRFAYKAAGAGAWTDWTTNTSNVEVGNLFASQDVSVSGNVETVTATVHGTVSADGNLVSGGEFKYGNSSGPALRSRTTPIPIHYQDSVITHGNSGFYSIVKPVGSHLGQVDVKVLHSDGVVTAGISVIRTHTFNFGSGGVPTSVFVDSDTTSAGAGVANMNADFGGLIVSDAEEYWLSIGASGASGDVTVLGARITWQDPGPINQ